MKKGLLAGYWEARVQLEIWKLNKSPECGKVADETVGFQEHSGPFASVKHLKKPTMQPHKTASGQWR
jgi:hypothetical protein